MKILKYLYTFFLLWIPFLSYANCGDLESTLRDKFYPDDLELNFHRVIGSDCQVLPADPSKTIVAFLTKDNDILDANFNLDVMLVDSQSGEVIARDKEKNVIQRENELIKLSIDRRVEVGIDTTSYKLNPQVSVFGIRIFYNHIFNGLIPYTAEYINLYSFQNKNLTRALNNLEVKHIIFNEDEDQIHLHSPPKFDHLMTTLSLSQHHTNGFADIIVSEQRGSIGPAELFSDTTLKRHFKRIPKHVFILRYDGKEYVIPKRNDIQYRYYNKHFINTRTYMD